MNDKNQAVRDLVEWHFEVSPGTLEAYYFTSSGEPLSAPVRLLEVNTATIETGEVDTFGFAPSSDFEYPLIMRVVTPFEMDQIRTGKLPLPQGWDLREATRLVNDEVVRADAA